MPLSKMLRASRYPQSGMALMETVVALAILGMVAVIIFSGVVATSKAAFLADEQATAESLAQSQMEYAQNATYVYGATQYSPASLPASKDYINYSASITATPLHTPDAGIQKITVTITRSGREMMKLEGYKVDR